MWKQLSPPTTSMCLALLGFLPAELYLSRLNSISHQPLYTLLLTPFNSPFSMSTAMLNANYRLHAAWCVTVDHRVRMSCLYWGHHMPKPRGAGAPGFVYAAAPLCALS